MLMQYAGGFRVELHGSCCGQRALLLAPKIHLTKVLVNEWHSHFVRIGIHISSSESGSAFLYLSPNTSK